MTATVTTNFAGGTYSLADLKAAMAKLTPAPIYGSHPLFPSDKATRWKEGRQEYVIAAPAFWAKLPVHTAGPAISGYGGLRIDDMSEERNRELWESVVASLCRVIGGVMDGRKTGHNAPTGV